jgi:hypothetical protein
MNRSKDIGTAAETAVVRYLREHGWPGAERRALAGAADLGDITGCPGLVWEIKGGKKAETASDSLIRCWLADAERERMADGADLGILVTKRKNYGPERAGSWWVHVDLVTWMALSRGRIPLAQPLFSSPIRMHLSTLLPLLHAAGYGTAPEAAPDVQVVA